MNKQKLKKEAEEMVWLVKELTIQGIGLNISLEEESIVRLACALYKHKKKEDLLQLEKAVLNKKMDNDWKGGKAIIPPNQLMNEGEACLNCGNPLKVSKKGNAYCDCWYKEWHKWKKQQKVNENV
jgi:hypothetical protein